MSGGPSAYEEYRRLIGELPVGIAGAVELVARQLSDNAQSLLRLSAIPHGFDAEVAAALMPELAAEERAAAAGELDGLSFVVETAEGRVLHDQVRDYLFGQWLEARDGDGERWRQFREASARLAEHFAAKGADAVGEARAVAERQRIFHLLGAEPDRGFAAFERHCRAERYCHRLESCGSLIKLVEEYGEVLEPRLREWLTYHQAKLALDLRHHDEAVALLDSLLDSPSVAEQPALRARCLFRLATALREQREFERARGLFRQLGEYAEAHPEAADQKLRALQGYASLLIEMGRADEAESVMGEVLSLAQAQHDRPALATAWNTMGILHRRLGRPKRALQAFREALAALAEGDEQYRPRQVYNNIGLLYADQADWEPAREMLERSREIAQRAGDMNGEATALSNLGRVYLALGRPGDALAAAESAIQLFQAVHNWFGAGMTCRGMGRYYRRQLRRAEARAALERARAFFLRAGAAERAEEAGQEIEEIDNPRRRWGWVKWLLFALGLLLLSILALVGIAMIFG